MNTKPLIAFIVALVCLIIAIVAYGFSYSFVTAESVRAQTLSADMAQQRNATTQIAKATEEMTELSPQESSLDQYFVQTNNVVPFLEQIQSIGKYLGATVQVVSVSAVPGTPYGHLDLSLSITGTFDAVARTIGAIEYEPYDTSISSVSLTSGAVASSSPNWTAAATFSIGAKTGNSASAPSTTTP